MFSARSVVVAGALRNVHEQVGLAKREVDLLKEEITALEAELQSVYEQVEAGTTALVGLEGELKGLADARNAEAASSGENEIMSHTTS